MAFNDLGPRFWIAPGATIRRTYNYGGDWGAQYAMARLHTDGARVFSIAQGKYRYWWGSVEYYVDLRNEGPMWASCSLDGGGST